MVNYSESHTDSPYFGKRFRREILIVIFLGWLAAAILVVLPTFAYLKFSDYVNQVEILNHIEKIK